MSPPETTVAPHPAEPVDASPVEPDAESPDTRTRGSARRFLEANGLLALLVMLVVFFAVYPETSEQFLTKANLQILVANQAVLALVTLALLFPLVCNEFDLSVGAAAGLVAIFVASLFSSGLPVLLVLAIGIAIGAAVGIVNGFLVTRMKINGIVATLGTSTLIGGIVLQKTGGLAVVSDIPASVTNFGSGNTLGIPNVALVLVVIALLAHFILEHTAFGRQLYAIGSNRAAAGLVGIKVQRAIALTFLASGVLACTAGLLYVARTGGADPQVGPSFLLPAFAGAFLSATTVKPGRPNVGGAIVAIFLLAVIDNGLNLAGGPTYLRDYVNGAALIVGVAVAGYLYRKRKS